MADRPNTVQVEIFGQVYSVRAGKEPGYIEHIAAYVDAQMREVSRAAGAVDSMKIAVLGALNIADELFRAKLAAHQAEEKVQQAQASSNAQSEEAQAEAVKRLQEAHAAADEKVRAAEAAAEQRVKQAEDKVKAVEAMAAQRIREAEGKTEARVKELAHELAQALEEAS